MKIVGSSTRLMEEANSLSSIQLQVWGDPSGDHFQTGLDQVA
jgi:hypothetical protein